MKTGLNKAQSKVKTTTAKIKKATIPATTLLTVALAVSNPQEAKSQVKDPASNSTTISVDTTKTSKAESTYQVTAEDFSKADNIKNQEKNLTSEMLEATPDTIREITTAVKQAEKVNVHIYWGMLSGINAPITKLETSGFVNLRVGGSASIPITHWLSADALAALDYTTGGKASWITLAALNIKPNENTKITVWKALTPITYNHRSSPLSQDGQFETFTQSLVPASIIGVSAQHTFNKDGKKIGSVGASIGRSWENTEYGLAGSYKGAKASVWKNSKEKNLNAALTLDYNNIHHDFVIKGDVLANGNYVPLKKDLGIYNDVAYNTVDKKFVSGQIWIMKLFEQGKINGIIAGGYDATTKEFGVYLLLSL